MFQNNPTVFLNEIINQFLFIFRFQTLSPPNNSQTNNLNGKNDFLFKLKTKIIKMNFKIEFIVYKK